MTDYAVETPTDMQYDGNDIQHDNVLDDMIGDAVFTPGGESLDDAEHDDDNPFEEFLTSERPDFDEPDASLLSEKRRVPNSKKYERKVAGLFSVAVKVTVANPHTLADSAALLMYGPDISKKAGDLCAVNPRAARIVDMITDQTENPATALIMATAPLVLQVIRNHEPVVERDNGKQPRTLRIPFTKRRLRFKLGFKLNRRMRNLTHDPVALQRHVFTNKDVVEALQKQGIHLVVE